ncbi:alkane monooxygenase [Dyadobacter frigoris]|uniref:MsnO8 family LLM class oxidoreductase n=1 Tax=Dyadobacter frigoris TaxID=2576211 RepID=UPI0024A140FD|nr:MsnO8 family LLM class oxidoreductase [Dyadobacter frigoris]GLU54687.1 alkane monooxygenase [Dyadobacter frigoris]
MKLSIVDMAVIQPGDHPGQTLQHSVKLAQKAEFLGYERIWFSEHHANHIVSRAPEVMIAAVAAKTSKIRVGSGSVLLNHYSAYKVAETFCTLNELYPGRIDLGIGRATTGQVIDLALQQDRSRGFLANSDEQLNELMHWMENSFSLEVAFSNIPIHTIASRPEIHLSGTSSWSSTNAGRLGLRYIHAAFFNPDVTRLVIDNYRANFAPSDSIIGLREPEARLGIHVVCADTEEEALIQLASVELAYHYLRTRQYNFLLPAPNEAIKILGYLPRIQPYIKGTGVPPRYIAGTFEQVAECFYYLSKDLNIDEFVIQDMMTDQEARLHSYELLSALL